MLVEDEFLVSLLIEDVLADQHCLIVGPFDRLPSAVAAARSEAVDLAVLDVNIAGERVYPVAEILAARRIPFVFLSGYGRRAVPKEHPEWPVCRKPFRAMDLVRMLEREVSRV